MKPENIDLNNFDIDRVTNKLGNGAYGSVFWTAIKGGKYAIKEISKQHVLKYSKIKSVFRERDLLKMVDSRFVIGLDCTL